MDDEACAFRQRLNKKKSRAATFTLPDSNHPRQVGTQRPVRRDRSRGDPRSRELAAGFLDQADDERGVGLVSKMEVRRVVERNRPIQVRPSTGEVPERQLLRGADPQDVGPRQRDDERPATAGMACGALTYRSSLSAPNSPGDNLGSCRKRILDFPVAFDIACGKNDLLSGAVTLVEYGSESWPSP